MAAIEPEGVATRGDNTVEHSFDEMARGLANGTVSRRRVLRMVGAVLVGATFASVPGVAWAEKCRRRLRKCTTNRQCCSRNCIKNPQGNGRICGCPVGKTLCDNQCVVCDNIGEVVNPSTCQCECPTGEVLCNNECVSNVCDPNTGEVFNPTTCRCECPSGRELCSGNNTCVQSCDPTTGEVLVVDPTTGNCRCECPVDTVLCGGACVSNTCGTNETFNPETCRCEPTDMCDPQQNLCGTNPHGHACACRREAGTGRAVCIEGRTYHCTTCTSTSQCPPGTVCTQFVGDTVGHCSTLCGAGCPYTTQCCAPGYPTPEAQFCEIPFIVSAQCAQEGY